MSFRLSDEDDRSDDRHPSEDHNHQAPAAPKRGRKPNGIQKPIQPALKRKRGRPAKVDTSAVADSKKGGALSDGESSLSDIDDDDGQSGSFIAGGGKKSGKGRVESDSMEDEDEQAMSGVMGMDDDDEGGDGIEEDGSDENMEGKGKAAGAGVRREREEPTIADFEKFRDKQRDHEIYGAMNELEQDRYELLRGTNFNDKQMKKLLSMIPGTGKTTKKIITAIRSLCKIYVGQLVEEAKVIQNEEVKEEQLHYNRLYQEYRREAEEKGEDPSIVPLPPVVMNNGNLLGPVLPNHLMEARRRLLGRGELVRDRPKPMFLRRTTF